MKRALILAAVVSLLFLLTACPIPEKFLMKIDLDKSGRFSFAFDGVVVCDPELKDEPSQKAVAVGEQKWLKRAGCKKAKYKGRGRFEVSFRREGLLNKPFEFYGHFEDVITMVPRVEGEKRLVYIKGRQPDPELIQILKKMNIVVDGELVVKTSGVVLKHNATEPPTFQGQVGTYRWKIKIPPGPAPMMLVRIK